MSLHVHHLALRTRDVAALAAFYHDVLGLDVVRDSLPHSLWLALGPGAVLMIEAREAGEPPVPAGSMELFAIGVDDAARETIRARAVERGCYEGETAFTVYLRDPDGRRVGASTYDLSGTRS